MIRWAALGLVVVLFGCAPAARVAPHSAPLADADVEVVLTPVGEALPGADAEPRFRAELVAGEQRRTLSEVVLAAMAWNGGAAVLRVDHSLVYEHVDGRTIEVAADAFGPVVSADAAHLAYAVRRADETFDVVVHDGSQATTVARGLVSAGGFRFSGDARLVAFLAAENGRYAGAWIARTNGRGARCLTMCSVRVGDSAIVGGMVTPLGPDDFLAIDEGLFRWRDENGGAHDVPWEMP